MSAHDTNPAAKATALLGTVTQHALSTAGKLAFSGVTTGLHVLGRANSVRKRIRRTGDTALQIAAVTPLGRLLPEPKYDDDAASEGHRIAHPPKEAPVPRAVRDLKPVAPTRDDLPIADFDSVSIPSLRSRLRSLSVADLAMLREYERAHAGRLPVITMLDNRLAKLAAADADADAASSGASG
jgi:hypothetical protein